jgi:hypothetical protein
VRPLEELAEFLAAKMSMTANYQPVVVAHLLRSGGTAPVTALAEELARRDPVNQRYYRKVLMRWPKKTLEAHGIVQYDRAAKAFTLLFDVSDADAVETMIKLCELKMVEWERTQRGTAGVVRRYLQLSVLKEARRRCALCRVPDRLRYLD